MKKEGCGKSTLTELTNRIATSALLPVSRVIRPPPLEISNEQSAQAVTQQAQQPVVSTRKTNEEEPRPKKAPALGSSASGERHANHIHLRSKL